MIEDLKQGFTSQEAITFLAFDPQEEKAYLGDAAGRILIFDLARGEEVTKFDVASEPIKTLHRVKERMLIFGLFGGIFSK